MRKVLADNGLRRGGDDRQCGRHRAVRRPSTCCFTTMTAMSMTAAVTPPNTKPNNSKTATVSHDPLPLSPSRFVAAALTFVQSFAVNFRLTVRSIRLQSTSRRRGLGSLFEAYTGVRRLLVSDGRPRCRVILLRLTVLALAGAALVVARAGFRARRRYARHAGRRFPGTAVMPRSPRAVLPAPPRAIARPPSCPASGTPSGRTASVPCRPRSRPPRTAIATTTPVAPVRASRAAPSRHLPLRAGTSRPRSATDTTATSACRTIRAKRSRSTARRRSTTTPPIRRARRVLRRGRALIDARRGESRRLPRRARHRPGRRRRARDHGGTLLGLIRSLGLEKPQETAMYAASARDRAAGGPPVRYPEHKVSARFSTPPITLTAQIRRGVSQRPRDTRRTIPARALATIRTVIF